MQWSNKKDKQTIQWSPKHYTDNQHSSNINSTKNGGGGLRCSCRVSSFWSTTSTRVYNVPTYIFVDAYVCLFDLIFVILICGRIVDFCDISLLLSVLCQFLLFVLPFSTKVLSTMKILKSMFVV